MNIKNRLLLSLSICVATLGLSLGSTAFAGKNDDTLNVAFSSEPEALDTYKIAGREGLIIARHIYDGLLYKDLDTNEIKPALAESWKFIDPLTMEFSIRKGVKFHNGADLTATDVVTTFNTVLKPEYGTRYQISVDWMERVEKIDDYTVRIYLSKQFAGAIEMLSDALPIYPHKHFSENGSAGMSKSPIGTGPYKLVEKIPGVKYVLERFNDHYEGSPKGRPGIGKIVVRTIPEMNTQYAELMSGKLDWIWRIPADQAKRLKTRVNVINAPIMRISYIGFAPEGGNKEFPINNKLVRQAIIHAVNREQIVSVFGGSASKVLNAACNPQQFGCEQDVTSYEYSPEKAKKLLAQAGYQDGFEMDIVFAAMPRPVAESVASDLLKVGIKVTLNENQYSAAVKKWRDGSVPGLFSNWGSYGIGDVVFILSNFFGGGSDDMIKDQQISDWIKVADTSTDRDERKENYSKALKKIAAEAYWMPMYNFNINYGLSQDVVFTPHPDEFARWWLSSWK